MNIFYYFDFKYKGHSFKKVSRDNNRSFICQKCKWYCFLTSNNEYYLWNDANFDGVTNISCDEIIIKDIIE